MSRGVGEGYQHARQCSVAKRRLMVVDALDVFMAVFADVRGVEMIEYRGMPCTVCMEIAVQKFHGFYKF